MSNQIEQIRAEIVRRIKELPECSTKTTEGAAAIRHRRIYEAFLSFIDAIPAETIQEDVQEEETPTCKTCRHYENDCAKVLGKFIPYPSRVCKDYSGTTAQAQPAPAATFNGWVARDKCGELYFFKERPTRGATMWNTEDFCAFMPFPQRNLTALRWEDEPKEVEIIIKEVGK